MNNPYLLKKQLKDNEEELSNYLRDMNIWQDQMKRKERSSPLKNSNEKKKSKSCLSTKTAINKISSWDYSAWDKFDVDKACEDNDVKDSDSGNSIDQCTNQESQSESKLSEGLYEKNLGNALVQNQKWAEAILRYTRAIEYYDKDPVFYANRALCYLKTKEFKLAISDCTSSLKLDGSYVKSYQRRSVAFMALKMYKEAKKDLNKILNLEPNNKQAKLDIEVVNKKIKPDVIQKNDDIKTQKTNADNSNTSSSILFKDVENPKVLKWPSRVDCKQISSNQKPPHLRSKKPFCIPKIKDVSVDQDQEKLNNMHLLQTTLKEVCEKNMDYDQSKNNEVVTPVKKYLIEAEKKHCLVVPSPPQTYVQFKQDWAYLQTDSKLLFQYLKQIPGKHLPLIVRNSMDNELFEGLLKILRFEFIQNEYDITDYMIGISELPRLQMLVMFCSENEILCIKEMLNHISKSVSENIFKNLKTAFGI